MKFSEIHVSDKIYDEQIRFFDKKHIYIVNYNTVNKLNQVKKWTK